jgi:hypothetical protein
MIVVRLMGGLGNQMFQYALGRRLATERRTELKLDLHFLLDRRPVENFVFRDYALDVFKLTAKLARDADLKRIVSPPAGRWERAWDRLTRGDPFVTLREKQAFVVDENVLRAPRNAYLIGYWQNEKYLAPIARTLRNEFTFRRRLDGVCLPLAERLMFSNAVCLNVRRTDYVSNPDANAFLGVCGLDYYNRAVQVIASRVPDPEVFVFSDDVEWCKGHIRLDYPTTIVTHECAGQKFDHYLHLMTLCKHFVIPNSTFGWWAAWLCTYGPKIVVAPGKWVNDSAVDTSELTPAGWWRI